MPFDMFGNKSSFFFIVYHMSRQLCWHEASTRLWAILPTAAQSWRPTAWSHRDSCRISCAPIAVRPFPSAKPDGPRHCLSLRPWLSRQPPPARCSWPRRLCWSRRSWLYWHQPCCCLCFKVSESIRKRVSKFKKKWRSARIVKIHFIFYV